MPTIYAATEHDLLVVGDPLVDPTATRVLGETRPEAVCHHPDEPDRIFVGTFEHGLQRSTDGGASWNRIGTAAIHEDAVMSLAVHPDDPDVLHAGTEPSAVYRSTDGGDTWTRLDGLLEVPSEPDWAFPPRPHTHHARWIEVDPHDPEHLYVGIEAGALVQTRDGGETWADRVPGSRRDTHSMATHRDAPDRAWVAAGDGFAVTHDAGETWDHPQDGLHHRYCWSVALDPADPETVIMSAASGAGSAHRTPGESYVYRRVGDDAWERLDERGLAMGEGVLRAVIRPDEEAGEFWAANNRGLFHTRDAGDSWSEIGVDWPDEYETSTIRGMTVVTD